jgi:hypothetical protein
MEDTLVTAYVQADFGDQPLLDSRIEGVNALLGTQLDRSSVPSSERVGLGIFRRVSDRWWLGIQGEYATTTIVRSGTFSIHKVVLRQKNSALDFLGAGRLSVCASCSRAVPFLLAGVGAGYLEGRTFHEPSYTVPYTPYRYSVAEARGWVPIALAGFGVSTPFGTNRRWSVDLYAGYRWGQLRESVVPEGSARFPGEESGETVMMEVPHPGPIVSVGLSRRF